eukprot:2484436-Pleurochrysis_carterae.AAC.1
MLAVTEENHLQSSDKLSAPLSAGAGQACTSESVSDLRLAADTREAASVIATTAWDIVSHG